MPGFTPFMEHRRNEPVAAHADITGPDDQVVGFGVVDLGFLVGFDPLVLVMPFGEEEADGTFSELREILFMKRVCLRANFTSPLKLRLSHTNTDAPATIPAGKVLSWEFLSPSTQQ